MAIDTKPTMLERVVEARKDRARFRRKNGMDSAMELIIDEPAAATRPNLDALLAHLDEVFRPLMERARARRETSSPAPAGAAAPSGAQLPPPVESDISPEDQAKLDGFLATCVQPPPLAVTASPLMGGIGADGKRLPPRRGFGPPVFVGFDCEWEYQAKGRNVLLSVQFYVIGPTGLRYSKVINLVGKDAVQDRPSLAEALYDLLDEAEIECIFDEWPEEVVLCGHFTRADISVFRDFKQFRHQLQAVNGTLATTARPAQVKLPLREEQAERLKHRYRYVVGDDFDPRVLSVRIVDSARLAPPGTPLAKLGEWLNVPKVMLPKGYRKSEMRRLQRKLPWVFKAYGLRDAEIAVLYALWVLWFCDRYLGIKGLSATASGLSVRLVQLCMRRDGVHPDVALNFEKVRRWRWNEATGRPTSQTQREPTRVRRWFEAFFADVYMGGRNECYWFGPTPMPQPGYRLFDHDLAACYVVSLAGIMCLDYERIEITRDPERFRGHVAGYAEVEFRFPEGTLYPCLAVMMEKYGLWYPLSGIALATAPEIELALEMGAEITVRFGVVIPWKNREAVFAESAKRLRREKTKKDADKGRWLEADGDVFVPAPEMQFPPESHGDGGYRPFESFSIYTRSLRLKFDKKSLPHQFMKLASNGAYGKSGQGFKGKRALDMADLKYRAIGPSGISEPAVAALVSGFARAVLGEILWKLPAGALAVSATTDGALVSVETLNLSGTMCRRFQALVDRIAPGTGMTELKHLIGQAVAGKTRLQLTGLAIEGQEPVVAKGGIKVPLDSADGDEEKERALMRPENQNRFMLDLFANRQPGQIIQRPSLMSLGEMVLNDWDLQTLDTPVRLNMEYDFKRRPVDARMVRIESLGVEHLAFATVPWDNAAEGELARMLFDRWREGEQDKDGNWVRPAHCLKTMADWADWQAFYGLYAGNHQRRARFQALQAGSDVAVKADGADEGRQKRLRGPTGQVYATARTGMLGTAIRTFLAAYVQRAWGLEGADLSQAKLAAWLTQAGYPVKVHDVKNAGRSQLHEHVSPATREVMAFLEVVKARFPGLETGRFLVRG